MGCARARVFMVAYRTDKLVWDAPFGLNELVECLRGRVVMTAKDYYYMDLPRVKLSDANERNLADYNSESRKLQFPDLNQYAKNGRGRGETVDNALPTLTTTSGRLFSQAHHRFLHPDEMLASHALPISKDQGKACRAPTLELDKVPYTSKVHMAGNAINIPTIGSVMLAAALAFQPVQKP
ncbi:unnamed protein product [Durusdinium trenchii]